MFPFSGWDPREAIYYGTKVSASERRPIHLAFVAPTKEAVDEFHRLGLKHGGVDNGAPEDGGGGCYAAYLLDPDGNNIEAIYRGEVAR